ncbi:pilus assembly protein TadG-related protein [Salsipaludibacter albus]|uniref:pilus assembly protein TadG-related protein n=1 Tax=Salsipaludibacter albus TaxID=2849650 RepID=UPI001EE41FA3|nr:pilus assembly protein TadG-related protein [Salsipaludibacter albus]MBY5162909.1 Tad domain-containing protein [Salsipaludibacter albus]
MRICRDATRQEDGAVAIIVAVCLIVLLGISAFVVDFGLAYTNRRQLQTAADAAALAGALVYEGEPGSCIDLVTDPSLRGQAYARATTLMRENHAEATGPDPTSWTATCTPAGRVSVPWSVDDPVESGLSGVFGVTQVDTNASATASIPKGPINSTGLRPYAVCSSELPAALPSAALRVNFEGHAKGNECDGPAGNWRQMDCPNQEPKKLDDATAFGCTRGVTIVPDQESPGDLNLRDTLLAACPPDDTDGDDCLSGNTGNDFTSNPVITAWDGLLGQTIQVPVVCGATACPSEAAFINVGTKAQLPVHRIVEVVVCGYHWQKNKARSVGTGQCSASTYRPGGADDVDKDKTQDQYLVFVFKDVIGDEDGGAEGGDGVALIE